MRGGGHSWVFERKFLETGICSASQIVSHVLLMWRLIIDATFFCILKEGSKLSLRITDQSRKSLVETQLSQDNELLWNDSSLSTESEVLTLITMEIVLLSWRQSCI